jgi:hypothetical protein
MRLVFSKLEYLILNQNTRNSHLNVSSPRQPEIRIRFVVREAKKSKVLLQEGRRQRDDLKSNIQVL